jgi:predicted kinase
MDPLTVRVDFGGRGGWAIALPGEGERVTCDTLEDARRLARRWAEDRSPCEVVVCDAYHRVLYREIVARAPEGADVTMN